MTELDKKEFALTMAGLGEAYSQSFTKEQLKIYFNLLIKYSIEQVKMAASLHVKDPDRGRFLPKPADLVFAISGDLKSKSLIAFGDVMNAVKKLGSYPSIVFEDVSIMQTIENMGGWRRFCMLTESELPFFEKSFIARYEYYAIHGIEEGLNRIKGLSEAQGDKDFEVATICNGFIKKQPYECLNLGLQS